MYTTWKKIEDELCATIPLKVKILFDDGKSVRILVCDRDHLNKALKEPGIDWFLNKHGYDMNMGLEGMLDVLSDRFSHECPHEIGIFLGYPLHDVMNFIYEYRPCLLTGYWKVYCHPHEAEKAFASFDEARFLVEKKLLIENDPIKTFYHLCKAY